LDVLRIQTHPDRNQLVLFGDHHIHGAEGVRFYTRAKAITTRWPEEGSIGGSMHFPTAS
jgi:malonate-semialdehyde dehydrogenase (acetylating)/methylmalonate-semialdehyde dehydrogenase